MTAKEILDRLLRAYGDYYDVTRSGTAQSGTARSGTAQPGTARSGTAQPGMALSGTARSGTAPGPDGIRADAISGNVLDAEPDASPDAISGNVLDAEPDASPDAVLDAVPDAYPFAAEAVFHSHEEQFFLVRSARIAEAESHEYVFFAVEEDLTADRLRELSGTAWELGTARTVPHENHRNTDTTLIVLADRIAPDALALVPKLKRYKSYRWGFQGWSHFLLFAVEASTGRCAWNRQGRRLRALIQSNIREP